MTDLEQHVTDYLRRRAAAATPRYDLERIEQETILVSPLELDDRGSRPPTVRLLAIAACLLAIVSLAAIVIAERDSVDTTKTSDTPPQITAGPTTLARGVVEFVEAPVQGIGVPPGGGLAVPAGQGLGGQTMDITAVEQGGEVTGEARLTLYDVLDSDGRGFEVVVDLTCADTSTGDVILGGTVTTVSGGRHSGSFPRVGALMAVIIRAGEPDSATVWWTPQASSCTQGLESVPQPRPDDRFVDVVEGDDIETG